MKAGRDVARAAALALVVSGLGALAYDRAGAPSLAQPLSYRGDALAFLAGLKAARDGHVAPLRPIEVPELNAPFGASWNDFPNRQPTLFWLAGLLARQVGLFATVNLLLLFAHASAAVAFYLVARYLRCRWEWAAAGALAFALSPYLFWRADRHLSLSLYGHLPLCLLVLGWCFGRRGLYPGRGRFAFAVAVAGLTGLGNVYYAALFVQFLGWSALAQLLRRKGARSAVAPLLLAALVMGLVVAENAYYLAYRHAHGANPGAFSRSYGDVERLALKPIELVLPRPEFGLLGWGRHVRGYWTGAAVWGERGPAYLGLLGVAAFAWLLSTPVRAALARGALVVPPALAAIAWVLAFSSVGGVNGLLSLVGPPWLRATNRFSVWILAVALLAGALRVSRAAWTRRRLPSLAAAALAAALAWGDQVAVPRGPRVVGRPQVEAPSDARFVAALEERLPAGAMLFQVPVTPFPEAPPVGRMGEYEHFRPYLFAQHLRFSYGTDRGRPRDEWQTRLGGKPPAELARALEAYGFSGLLVSRRGYADGGRALLDALAEEGRPPAADSDDGDFVFVPLVPAAGPRRPSV